MKSDIIYKIGTAEFRKRYIDPAIKSGKVSYDYKLRWGTQAFREKCMEIVLGEGSEESTTPIWWYNKDYDIEVPEGVETTKVTGNIRFVIMIDAASA